jgi:hypothetical protein
MNYFNLNAAPEMVRNVLLPLSLDQGGTAVELNGHVVAYILPKPVLPAASDEPWTDAKNARRFELIDRKYDGPALSYEEEIELLQLQEQSQRYVRRIAPLPLDAARKLHGELLERSRWASSS